MMSLKVLPAFFVDDRSVGFYFLFSYKLYDNEDGALKLQNSYNFFNTTKN